MKFRTPRFLFRRYELMRMARKGDKFLEIGPGDLSLAMELLDKFKNGVLVDFNTTHVQPIYDSLNDTQKQRLKLLIADFSQPTQFDTKFNCVVACEVLEHIEKDGEFLKKAYDLTVDNGQLLLSVPARQKFWSTDDVIVGHFRRYEKDNLYKLLADVGYSDIKILSYGYPFQNLVRLARVALARFQYREKSNWDMKKQSQQSAFMVNRSSYVDMIAIILNKYTIYPFCLFASLFRDMDLGEGYVVSATKYA